MESRVLRAIGNRAKGEDVARSTRSLLGSAPPRKERSPVVIPSLVFGGLIAYVLAYRYYGRFLERVFDLGADRPTPAHELSDGRDYHPASLPVLFGHHFSSIAGAGPIVGPIIATIVFGWAPAVAWIIFGSIFIGGVHDFGALALSIKHRAGSIALVARAELSPLAGKLLLAFTWLAIVYVLAVFLDLTATTFAPRLPPSLSPEVAGRLVRRGGAVASASLMFIGLALALGWMIRRRASLGRTSLFFLPALFVTVYLGTLFPVAGATLPSVGGSATTTWSLLLIGYCFVASVTPVWLLLQPRDYLSSFLLYACLLGGLAGIGLSGFTGGPSVGLSYPAFIGFHSEKLGYLFPALFITVACGACSGFHSVVASGTTAKQLDRERHARPIGYGSMLVEGLLALVAVATVSVLAPGSAEIQLAPPAIFAEGLGRFLALLGIPQGLAQSFAMLALSTFLLTTLDTGTRLGRYILEELFSLKGLGAHHCGPQDAGRSGVASGSGSRCVTGRGAQCLSTAATLAVPTILALVTFEGPGGQVIPVWKMIWPVFGSTNQLLGGLALLVITVWLRRAGRPAWVTLIPTVLMLSATLLALIQLVARQGASLVGGIAGLLLLLGLVLLVEAGRALRRPPPTVDNRSSVA